MIIDEDAALQAIRRYSGSGFGFSSDLPTENGGPSLTVHS